MKSASLVPVYKGTGDPAKAEYYKVVPKDESDTSSITESEDESDEEEEEDSSDEESESEEESKTPEPDVASKPEKIYEAERVYDVKAEEGIYDAIQVDAFQIYDVEKQAYTPTGQSNPDIRRKPDPETVKQTRSKRQKKKKGPYVKTMCCLITWPNTRYRIVNLLCCPLFSVVFFLWGIVVYLVTGFRDTIKVNTFNMVVKPCMGTLFCIGIVLWITSIGLFSVIGDTTGFFGDGISAVTSKYG